PGALNGLALNVSGAHSADFAVSSLSAATLAAGGSLTFDVTYTPTGGGLRTALLQVLSNDPDEAPFQLHLAGSNLLEIAFDQPAHVPLTVNGYAAPPGLGLGLQLGFTPEPGTMLTLVNNTSAAPITGLFAGVAEGGIVGADHDGQTYYFHVSYAGGDGNDLVLTEAYRWTWMKGSTTGDVTGTYGELGVLAAPNSPGSRYNSQNLTDAVGRLWLFGGEGYITTSRDLLNDLWMFDPLTRLWVWQGGSSTRNPSGIYGEKGVAAPGNVPGGRQDGITWTDDSGRFWIFGGRGIDASGSLGNLGDLWCFDPVSRLWTWMGGSTLINTPGVYGTKAVAAAANWPGARYNALTWRDREGNVWLFGGSGVAATPSFGVLLNDLWKFSAATGQWTWVGGSDAGLQNGNYGTLGTPSPTAFPGARASPCGWVGAQGELWLFGGSGYGASKTTARRLNDLWRFNPESAQWTWIGGSQEGDEPAQPAELLKPSLTVLPSGRSSPAAWTDGRGRFWLMGGYGFRVNHNVPVELNDVWMFDPGTSLWTWVKGSTTERAVGIYGDEGVSTADVAGGGRSGASVFPTADASGDLWVFGGTGIATLPDIRVSLNDLWKLDMPDLPALAPGAVTGIPATGTSATLNAAINPNGKASRLSFVVGTTPDLANATILSTQNVSASSANLPAAQSLIGLGTATTYFYRVYAANYSGPSFSELRSFTTPAVPDIAIEQPVGTELASGQAATDFGTVVSPLNRPITFTLRNTGTATLADFATTVSGTHAADFTAQDLPASLAPGASATFTVTFAPLGAGEREALLQIASNDPDEAPFSIHLEGYGLLPQSITFDAIGQQSCGTPLVLGAAAGSGLPVNYAITAGGGIASLTGNSVTFSAPGSVTIEATQAGDSSYAAAAPVSRSFTVVKGDQVIAFDPGLPETISFSGTVNLAASSDRGLLPVTFGIVSGPGIITGSTLSFSGPGDVVVQAAQAGDTAFNPGSAQKVITAFNTPPVANAGAVQGDEDTTITGNATATDAQGTALTYLKVSNPLHGMLIFNANGSFNYQPELNFNGTDSFTFKANDSLADSIAATITITVNAVNDSPVAVNGAASGDEDAASITGTASASDVDAGATLTYSKVGNPTNGSVTVNANGSFDYVPVLNFNGVDSFTFKANDGLADSNVAAISLTIAAVNDAPVASNAAASGSEDAASITGMVTASDIESDELTFTKVSDPANGGATVQADGSFMYVPNADFNGIDSFTAKANDGALDSNIVTVTITVGAVNDAPIASNGSGVGNEDNAINGTLGATDIDANDVLSFIKLTEPTQGLITVSGSTGAYTYVPNANSNGSDSFTFKVNDGTTDSNVATISLTITAVNDAPVVTDSSAVGVEGNLVRGTVTGTDVEASALTFVLVEDAEHGNAAINADGSYSYRPDAEFVGTDTFTFKANDGSDDSNIGTVTVVITTVLPEWTWMKGANTANQKGVYGTPGTPAAGNSPGGRQDAANWTDANGNFWLLGGLGHGRTTGAGTLNDLWEYDYAAGAWVWLKGGDEINAAAVYGTQGVPDNANVPGARSGAATWMDGAGNLWLFGGNGRDSTTTTGLLNDLWKYDPSANGWTWMKGGNLANSNGGFGPQGTPADSNTPSCRSGAVTWTDGTGCLWLFGGRGRGASGATAGNLNDLWKYDPATNQWTWMKGANVIDSTGSYGTQGSATATTNPGARADAAGWMDSQGSFWLFGGSGVATTATAGNLSDLWKYDPSMNQWTWVRGASTINAAGVYGTLGVVAPGNQPGSRNGAVAWTDATGALWLFGGTGNAATGSGLLSDAWRYIPITNTWTWMKGSNAANGAANYGALGIADPANTPSARRSGAGFG
ncbi:MAG: tandem-95 repeat protein, partial [Prosthecobacter sp.]|nr:tandem-95 repeat protein [Prosthecobacter sp.]